MPDNVTLPGTGVPVSSKLQTDTSQLQIVGLTLDASGAHAQLTALPLPTGASTEATLAAQSAKLPAALVGGRLSVDGSGVTQPVSIAGTVTVTNPSAAGLTDTQLRASAVPVSVGSIALPTGASTEATLAAVNTKLGAALPLPTGASTEATLAAQSAKLPATLGQKTMAAGLAVSIASDQSTLPVSNASLPLPAGASTSALQTTGNTSLASIDTKHPALVAGRVPVDGSGVTQPVSIAATVAVSNASLPLPAGASTEVTLAAQSAKLPATLGQKTMAAGLAVTIASDQSAFPVTIGSIALPTGASTSALQTPGNTSLASIDTKLPALSGGAVPTAPNVTRGAGNVDANTQRVVLSADGPLNVAIGTQADTTATTDSGSFSLMAFIKRGLANWTTLLARIPASVGGSLPVTGTLTTQPLDNAAAQAVRQTNPDLWRADFSLVSASGLNAPGMVSSAIGTGMTVAQAAGELNVTCGTTANSQVLIRSTRTFNGALILRFRANRSAAPANTQTDIILGDLIGETLAYTINSATSVTVTVPGTTWTAANVGQFVSLGALSSVGTPGRYAIASVSGTAITFTVAGFPASGSGTCTLYAWNAYRMSLTSVGISSGSLASQRNGWGAVDTATGFTNDAIQLVQTAGYKIALYDDPANSPQNTAANTQRALRTEAVDENVPLFLWLSVANGSTAPTSNTVTVRQLSVELHGRTKVTLPLWETMSSVGGGMPVAVGNTVGVNFAGSLNAVSFTRAAPTTDVGSAALTTTTTTGFISMPDGLVYAVQIPVTVVSGTTPTLDVVVQESFDGSTNWYDVWHFPRITATGVYTSPLIQAQAKWLRYVQTVAGTTPSFTRQINRTQLNARTPRTSQVIDRATIVLTTVNSRSITLNTQNMTTAQIVVNVGAATVAPQLVIDGSDDAGATWYQISASALTAVANSTVQQTVTGMNAQLISARVSSAGTGVTAGYVLIKGY